MLYGVDEAAPTRNTSNFWSLNVNLVTGRPSGTPVRVTTGDDLVDSPSVTSDGKRLVFTRFKPQLDVYLAEFSPKGPRLGTPRRLTLDDADDLPFDWTKDDSAVIFTSNRTGTSNVFNIFRQKIDETSADALVFSSAQKTIARLNPDGTEVLYLETPNLGDNGGQRRSEVDTDAHVVHLMRAPMDGGPPQTVIEAPYIINYQCSRAPAKVCVLSKADPKQFVLALFDPVKGGINGIC